MDLEIWLEMWNGQRFSTLQQRANTTNKNTMVQTKRAVSNLAFGYMRDRHITHQGITVNLLQRLYSPIL